MSTLVEIQKAIEALTDCEVDELVAWLYQRRKARAVLSAPPLDRQVRTGWPVPPPDVPLEELTRIEAVIEEAFSSLKGDA